MKKLILFIVFIFCLIPFTVFGTDVTLMWDANAPEDNVEGYKVYHGLDSRIYGQAIDVGNIIQHTINIPADDLAHYFAVTAYNTGGESDYSNEVSLILPIIEDPPPIDIVMNNFVLVWQNAEEFNSTFFGNTGKTITITWDTIPVVETSYSVRLYDINREIYLPESETSTSSITMIIASTGAYKIEIKPADNEWQILPFRIVAWISAPGPIVID